MPSGNMSDPVARDTPKATTVHDHPFEPIGEWWSLCKHCKLGRASHSMLSPEHDPPHMRPPAGEHTDEDDDHGPDEDLPIVTNEDTMLDAQMHLQINPEDATDDTQQ